MCTFFSICIVNWLVKKCVCVLTGHNYDYNIAIKSVKCRTTIVCSIGLITRNGIRVYIPKNERSKEKIPLCIYCYSIYGKQKVIVCPDGISFMLRTSTSICLDCCQNTHGIHLREWEKNMYTNICQRQNSRSNRLTWVEVKTTSTTTTKWEKIKQKQFTGNVCIQIPSLSVFGNWIVGFSNNSVDFSF